MKIADFLKAASENKVGKKRVGSLAFLQHYRDFLLGFPKIRSKVEACYRAMESEAVKPTPALTHICQLLMTEKDPLPKKEVAPKSSVHVKAVTGNTAKTVEAPTEKKKRGKCRKPYLILIFLKMGSGFIMAPEVEMRKVADEDSGKMIWKPFQTNSFTAETYMEAQNIADRKLATLEDGFKHRIIGHGVTTDTLRVDATARFWAKPKNGASKRVAKVSSNLGWGPRTRDYKQHFSGC